MRRLICAFVVHIGHKQVFTWRGSYIYIYKQKRKRVKKACHQAYLSKNLFRLKLSIFPVDVIVTGTSYADATKNTTDNPWNFPKSTFIGKIFDFPIETMPKTNNQNQNHKIRFLTKPQIQMHHNQTYNVKILDAQNSRDTIITATSQVNQTDNRTTTPKTLKRNTTYNANLRSNDFLYRGNRQNCNRQHVRHIYK